MNNFTFKQREQIRQRYQARVEMNARIRRKTAFGVILLFSLAFIFYPLVCLLLGD